MKSIILLRFYFFIVLGFGVSVAHSGDAVNFETREFKKYTKSNYILYSENSSSGCKTTVKVWNNSRQLELLHGEGCQASIGNSVEVAANNFNDIVNAFDLFTQFYKTELLTVAIGVHIEQEPLILHLNTANDWPSNYVEYFNAKATSAEDAFQQYREYLRNTILESRLYAPIFNVINSWGCDARLSANLFDPLFFDKHNVSKTDLIKWGVFAKGVALKDLFPSAKGGLEFVVDCSQRRVNRAQ